MKFVPGEFNDNFKIPQVSPLGQLPILLGGWAGIRLLPYFPLGLLASVVGPNLRPLTMHKLEQPLAALQKKTLDLLGGKAPRPQSASLLLTHPYQKRTLVLEAAILTRLLSAAQNPCRGYPREHKQTPLPSSTRLKSASSIRAASGW